MGGIASKLKGETVTTTGGSGGGVVNDSHDGVLDVDGDVSMRTSPSSSTPSAALTGETKPTRITAKATKPSKKKTGNKAAATENENESDAHTSMSLSPQRAKVGTKRSRVDEESSAIAVYPSSESKSKSKSTLSGSLKAIYSNSSTNIEAPPSVSSTRSARVGKKPRLDHHGEEGIEDGEVEYDDGEKVEPQGSSVKSSRSSTFLSQTSANNTANADAAVSTSPVSSTVKDTPNPAQNTTTAAANVISDSSDSSDSEKEEGEISEQEGEEGEIMDLDVNADEGSLLSPIPPPTTTTTTTTTTTRMMTTGLPVPPTGLAASREREREREQQSNTYAHSQSRSEHQSTFLSSPRSALRPAGPEIAYNHIPFSAQPRSLPTAPHAFREQDPLHHYQLQHRQAPTNAHVMPMPMPSRSGLPPQAPPPPNQAPPPLPPVSAPPPPPPPPPPSHPPTQLGSQFYNQPQAQTHFQHHSQPPPASTSTQRVIPTAPKGKSQAGPHSHTHGQAHPSPPMMFAAPGNQNQNQNPIQFQSNRPNFPKMPNPSGSYLSMPQSQSQPYSPFTPSMPPNPSYMPPPPPGMSPSFSNNSTIPHLSPHASSSPTPAIMAPTVTLADLEAQLRSRYNAGPFDKFDIRDPASHEIARICLQLSFIGVSQQAMEEKGVPGRFLRSLFSSPAGLQLATTLTSQSQPRLNPFPPPPHTSSTNTNDNNNIASPSKLDPEAGPFVPSPAAMERTTSSSSSTFSELPDASPSHSPITLLQPLPAAVGSEEDKDKDATSTPPVQAPNLLDLKAKILADRIRKKKMALQAGPSKKVPTSTPVSPVIATIQMEVQSQETTPAPAFESAVNTPARVESPVISDVPSYDITPSSISSRRPGAMDLADTPPTQAASSTFFRAAVPKKRTNLALPTRRVVVDLNDDSSDEDDEIMGTGGYDSPALSAATSGSAAVTPNDPVAEARLRAQLQLKMRAIAEAKAKLAAHQARKQAKKKAGTPMSGTDTPPISNPTPVPMVVPDFPSEPEEASAFLAQMTEIVDAQQNAIEEESREAGMEVDLPEVREEELLSVMDVLEEQKGNKGKGKSPMKEASSAETFAQASVKPSAVAEGKKKKKANKKNKTEAQATTSAASLEDVNPESATTSSSAKSSSKQSHFQAHQSVMNQLPFAASQATHSSLAASSGSSSSIPATADRDLLQSITMARISKSKPNMVFCRFEMQGGVCSDTTCGSLHPSRDFIASQSDLITLLHRTIPTSTPERNRLELLFKSHPDVPQFPPSKKKAKLEAYVKSRENRATSVEQVLRALDKSLRKAASEEAKLKATSENTAFDATGPDGA